MRPAMIPSLMRFMPGVGFRWGMKNGGGGGGGIDGEGFGVGSRGIFLPLDKYPKKRMSIFYTYLKQK